MIFLLIFNQVKLLKMNIFMKSYLHVNLIKKVLHTYFFCTLKNKASLIDLRFKIFKLLQTCLIKKTFFSQKNYFLMYLTS